MPKHREVIGIASFREGTVDVYQGNSKELSSFQLPAELRNAGDRATLNRWARETGLIKPGEQIAVFDDALLAR